MSEGRDLDRIADNAEDEFRKSLLRGRMVQQDDVARDDYEKDRARHVELSEIYWNFILGVERALIVIAVVLIVVIILIVIRWAG